MKNMTIIKTVRVEKEEKHKPIFKGEDMKKLLLIALLTSVAGAFAGCGCGCKAKKSCCKTEKCCNTHESTCEDVPCCKKEVVSTVTAKPCAHTTCNTTYTCPDGYRKESKKCACD